MASLDKLRGRDETVYWPGHGGPVREPQRFVRALSHHRRQREASIMNRVAAGDRSIPEIVAAIYEGLAPALRGAAASPSSPTSRISSPAASSPPTVRRR